MLLESLFFARSKNLLFHIFVELLTLQELLKNIYPTSIIFLPQKSKQRILITRQMLDLFLNILLLVNLKFND